MTSDEFFDSIQEHFRLDLPFVAYRKPNDGLLHGLLQQDSEVHHIIDFSDSGFVLAPFDDKQPTFLIPISLSKHIASDDFKSDPMTISKDHVGEDTPQRSGHIKLVDKGIDAILKNKFQKVVLSRKESVNVERTNHISIFKNLLNSYQNAFVYCWYHPKVGLWLGATPETLLTIDGNMVTTMALAGTQKFHGVLDVVWQQKEKDEQQFVTDFIVESLEPSVESLKISETETVRAGNLLHLKTTITAKLKPHHFNLEDIIRKLHPTPAVCGLPKEAAKQFILENETYNREYYTGFLGELNFKVKTPRNSKRQNVENNAYASIKTVSNLFVNLRCMQFKDRQAMLYIGGGITKDSIAENEWEETVSKAQVIKKVLY